MVDSIRALDPACLPLYGMSFFCSNAGFSHITGISCQQHTIPAPPQNIHIQTQQKSGGKYDVRPGLYTEPGGDPPGLLPTNKAGALKVAKENYQPDLSEIGRERPPLPILDFQRQSFRTCIRHYSPRCQGGSRRTALARITGISPLRGSLRAAPIA